MGNLSSWSFSNGKY